MKRINLTLILMAALVLTAQPTVAQEAKKKESKVFLTGVVADGFTKAAIPDVLVTLMRQDSTVVDTVRVWQSRSYSTGVGYSAGTTDYYLHVTREPAQYILRFEHPNYETTFTYYELKKVGRRVNEVTIPTTYMKKAMRAAYHEGGEIGEVVVKATKVKMVYRGDTIVYNADAFNVPEGSMLDGLIKQLPGVELTDEGEIFVNGKKVENLTLNGADFFKGKNQIMLQNLPYFTVKNVEVYKKQTPENRYLGINDEDKKELTMDIILKREYSIGGSANIEAGGGPSEGGESRYKLKGFGMRYSDRTRAVLFGGLNNINETMEYRAERSEYNDRSQQSGDRHFRQVGGQFVYLGPEDKVNNSTEVQAQWSDELTENSTQSETYMNGASTFGQSESTNRSKPSYFSLRNTLRAEGKLYSYSMFGLSYSRDRSESDGWNLTTADALMRDSINSSWNRSRSESESLSGSAYGNISKKLASGDALELSFNGSFSHSRNPWSQSQNHYAYHRLGTTDDRDRRTESPSYYYSWTTELQYNYQLTEDITFTPSLGIGMSVNSSDDHEYLRDSVDYLFDMQNSYEQKTRSLNRRAGLRAGFYKSLENHYLGLSGTLSVNFQRQRMNYDSQPLTTQLTRDYTLFSPNIFFYIFKKDYTREFTLDYSMWPQTPSVTDLIDRPITSDPLNIFLGNADLKASEDHNLSFYYQLRRDSIDQVISFRVNSSMTHNQRTQGYTYDMTTGKRTYRPENIAGGNWYIAFTARWDRALGSKKYFHIGNEATLRYQKSTSFAQSSVGNGSPVATSNDDRYSRVGTFTLNYNPTVRFQKGNLSLSLRGNLNYRNIHRSIEYAVGQQPTDIWDFSYGLNGSYKLPWNFTIDTDFSVHSRRGYADAEQNDNRLYWDASLTKSFMQGKWVMKLRGYDLLGQVSSLNYYVNAQGRTETWTNCMRRYALLTVSYRFSQKPKKKD